MHRVLRLAFGKRFCAAVVGALLIGASTYGRPFPGITVVPYDPAFDPYQGLTYEGPWSVQIHAGRPSPAFRDGTASDAMLGTVMDLVTMPNGDIVLADGSSVRRLRNGVLTTVAGTTRAGYVDGPGATARFAAIMSLTRDPAGNVYLADASNQCIRKLTPDGTVSTFAHIGLELARLVYSSATDAFFGVTGTSQAIYRITAAGATVFAGSPTERGYRDGDALTARFNLKQPYGLTLGADGALYLSDPFNHVVRRITMAGEVSTYAGSADTAAAIDGNKATARFGYPSAIAPTADGGLLVVDDICNRLARISANGDVTTLLSHGDEQLLSVTSDASGRIYAATSGAVDLVQAGQLMPFVGEYPHVTRDGKELDARFLVATPIACDAAGNTYVGDLSQLRRIAPDGTVTTRTFPDLWMVDAVTIDRASGAIIFTTCYDGLYQLANWRAPLVKLASLPRGNYSGVVADGKGTIYISDTDHHAIQQWTAAGGLKPFAGIPGTAGSNDGTVTVATFRAPFELVLDPHGNLYVADTGNHCIRRISPAGIVSTWAGAPGKPGRRDGPRQSAQFNFPASLALDADGNLLVADTGNGLLRRIGANETVVTLAGQYLESCYSGANGRTTGFDLKAVAITADGVILGAAGTAVLRFLPPYRIWPAKPQVTAGTSLTLSVTSDWTPSTYQWYKDDVLIPGATGETLPIASATAADAGRYAAKVTNAAGTTTAPAATLSVQSSWLANASVRTDLAAGRTLIAGFTLADGETELIVRGVGPGLAAAFPKYFAPETVLPNPRLSFYPNGAAVPAASNDDWPAILTSTFASLGAFPLPANSRDAALGLSMYGGNNTVHLTGAGSGIVLLEAYAPTSASGTRLVNLSVRNQVGSGNSILIAGFYIAGTGTKRLLIRGVGPGLEQLGVTGVLSNPTLEVHDASGSSIPLAANDDWDPALAPIFDQVYAFGLKPGSTDSALVVTLPAGAGYTAQVKGVNHTTGEALVEVYELP